jgi:hypothetical protein
MNVKMNKLHLLILTIIITTSITGCCGLGKNQFSENYSSRIGDVEDPPKVKPEIMVSESPAEQSATVSELQSQGAKIIGSCSFNTAGYSVCKSHLKSLAKKQGADFAVASSQFTNETRKVETVREYVQPVPITNSEGNKVGEIAGYWHDVRKMVVKRYFDYRVTLLRGKPEETVTQ